MRFARSEVWLALVVLAVGCGRSGLDALPDEDLGDPSDAGVDQGLRDFAGRDLSLVDLARRDFGPVDLAARDMVRRDMTLVDLAGRDLSSVDFGNIDFGNFDFGPTDLAARDFSSTDLSGGTTDLGTRCPGGCADGNPCTVDFCDPAVGCRNVAAPPGTACNDANACTSGDRCVGTTCVGTRITCNDNNPCTLDFCAPTLGCLSFPTFNGFPCNDGNRCTLGDRCVAGTCQPGTPRTCNDNNPCTVDGCAPTTGQCTRTPAPNGTGCNDNNSCTAADTCQFGTCNGLPVADGTSCGAIGIACCRTGLCCMAPGCCN